MSALQAADGEAMTIKVTLRPDVVPELYRELIALPERLRAQRLRALAAQGLAPDQAPAGRRSARVGSPSDTAVRLSGGKAPTRQKAMARQGVSALPVASSPLEGNAASTSERLSAAQTDEGTIPQARQPLGALPVAGEGSAGNGLTRDPTTAAQAPAEAPGRLEEGAQKAVPTRGDEAADPEAAGPRSNEEANRTGAFNLAVMMAKRGVFSS